MGRGLWSNDLLFITWRIENSSSMLVGSVCLSVCVFVCLLAVYRPQFCTDCFQTNPVYSWVSSDGTAKFSWKSGQGQVKIGSRSRSQRGFESSENLYLSPLVKFWMLISQWKAMVWSRNFVDVKTCPHSTNLTIFRVIGQLIQPWQAFNSSRFSPSLNMGYDNIMYISLTICPMAKRSLISTPDP